MSDTFTTISQLTSTSLGGGEAIPCVQEGVTKRFPAGTMAQQDADSVAITGGSISGVSGLSFNGTLTISMAGGATSITLTDARITVNSILKLGLPHSQAAASVLLQLWKSAQVMGSITLTYVNDGTSNSYPFDYEVTI